MSVTETDYRLGSFTRATFSLGSDSGVGCSLVSVVGSVDFLSVIRGVRVPIAVHRKGLRVHFDISFPDRDVFLCTFPVFSFDREVHVSVVFLCPNVS